MERCRRYGRGFGKRVFSCRIDEPNSFLDRTRHGLLASMEASMKKLSVLIFTFSCVLSVFGQRESVDTTAEPLEVRINKQIICDRFERQLKDIPFAAVRVFTRYKIASWLWKDGNDDTDRAEDIAVRAIDDLYANKAEIPVFYLNVLRPRLLSLLDTHAKDAANKLREKHKVSLEDEQGILDSLLNQKAGEKLATDAAIKLLGDQSREKEIEILVWRLQQRQSPELLRLLTAIVDAEETGRTRFTAYRLFLMSSHFVEPNVPVQLQKRFLNVAINRSRNAARMPEGDTEGFFNLLSGLISNISIISPELLPNAAFVQTLLKARTSQESKEAQERNARINDSSDKLGAVIAEAEQTKHKGTKYELYVNAAHLALKERKFTYSVDLVEKTVEIDIPSNIVSEPFRKQLIDQFLGQVVAAALQSGDPVSANYATKKIFDPLSKAESLRKTANYYFDQNDSGAAYTALDDAIKLITKVEGGDRRIFSLVNLLPTVYRIDRNRFSDLSELTAKSINSIPSLNVEDKPHTENFKNYVNSMMNINWNLLPVLTKLLADNKSEAANLAGRINKKEIRIIADYALSTDSMVQKAKSGKGQQ